MHVFGNKGTSAGAVVHGAVSAIAEARSSDAAHQSRGAQRLVSLSLRVLGALSVLAVGAVHLQQFFTLYSEIPTIGTLFVLNFVGATVIGLGLLTPIEALLGRLGGAVVTLLSLGGIALAAAAFVFLLVSERTPLFGFMEPGYDPAAILASRAAEAATVLFLGGFLVARFLRKAPAGR
ncbi:MAG: hypothetical protein ACRDNE_01230 [Gaiellaceae bacterium]